MFVDFYYNKLFKWRINKKIMVEIYRLSTVKETKKGTINEVTYLEMNDGKSGVIGYESPLRLLSSKLEKISDEEVTEILR